MKFYQVIALLFFANGTFAANNFDYAAFSGVYQLEFHDPRGDCELNDNYPLTLTNSPEDHSLKGTFTGKDNYLEIRDIDQGRKTFNSCWSDGVVGYSETTGNGSRVQYKTVYLKPGWLCEGGWPRYSTTTSWEIKGDLFTITYQSSDSPTKLVCQFKKVKP